MIIVAYPQALTVEMDIDTDPILLVPQVTYILPEVK